MTTKYPVDSTAHTCCRGIGRHARDCTTPSEVVGARCDGEPPQQEGGTMTALTTPDNATTWRDFAEQLPPHVIQRFERHELLTELHGPLAFPGEDPTEVIRKDRQMLFEEARNQVSFAHVALPAAATGCADLWNDDGDGNWSRVVDGRSRSTGPLSVSIGGVQSADGSVRWWVTAYAKDDEVTPEQIREYAVMLTDTADEFERLTT
ncbi:hypothetical protein [Mycolicibacterium sarraceniae]|uniref:Uncharacterized protein n=1 Tax=Mycolicibacterium sarraceniae TaxID=1534348 RepID=A0A7I7ST94_9MYCO|nr:hypothetical protein [Mycolicibacterium sarraceniae]BBY60217.1 hypothetical protein MSAR_33530 [Mycolicibacterium sarraceniae]